MLFYVILGYVTLFLSNFHIGIGFLLWLLNKYCNLFTWLLVWFVIACIFACNSAPIVFLLAINSIKLLAEIKWAIVNKMNWAL